MERERGITIFSKYTSFIYKGHLVNAVDTPGHADFGGEVERILGMVDGAVLLVDAVEGPLAQTKFVLAKALSQGLAPVVVLNKVDRPAATQGRCDAVASQLFDLFASLGADDRQLDFPLLYASAKQGWASLTLPPPGSPPPEGATMAPLLDVLLKHVPPPQVSIGEPFSMCVAMIERDPFVGRIATGRVASGKVKVGDKIRVLQHETQQLVDQLKISKIEKRAGVGKVQLQTAVAGDIVSIAGAGDAAGIADTIAAPTVTKALHPGHIDPPTISMVFSANDSPLAGRSGKAVTGRVIGQRLSQEAESSVSLKVNVLPGATEKYEVQARGEMQLAVVIEGLRREGLELAVSPPQVLFRTEAGRRLEPLEEVVLEVESSQVGPLIETLTSRKGELLELAPVAQGTFGSAQHDSNLPSLQEAAHASGAAATAASSDRQRLVFEVPARGMIGFKMVFANLTRGEGLLQRSFSRYGPYRGPISGSRKGALVSMSDGRATTYALFDLLQRGTFFVSPGDEVYAGMVVGEHNRDPDMDVNPSREKHLTNVRSVQSDEKMLLPPPRSMTLEEAIGYISQDELIEVTPAVIRLRKQVLDAGQRKVAAKRAATAAAAAAEG
eukprot:gene11018-11172_t